MLPPFTGQPSTLLLTSVDVGDYNDLQTSDTGYRHRKQAGLDTRETLPPQTIGDSRPNQADLHVPVISLDAADITDSTGSRPDLLHSRHQTSRRTDKQQGKDKDKVIDIGIQDRSFLNSLDNSRVQSDDRRKADSDVWETKDETTKSTVKHL